MKYTLTRPRKIAVSLLLLWGYNMFAPSICFALTSGPSQPEMQGFKPAGVSDMVDLQTGDFKYNIPLLDIDGYPINLNYQSGMGIDDEASWVGYGWNLNIGAINRQVRGLPDDFSGDKVETDHYTKPKITVGGRVTAKFELLGRSKDPKSTAKDYLSIGGTLSYGVFSDNYTGIGAELGVNAGISLMKSNDNALVAGLGFGVLSSTQSGVDVSPTISMPLGDLLKTKSVECSGLSASLGYNTRSGMKDFTMSSSFSFHVSHVGNVNLNTGTSITYNTPPVYPRVQIPYATSYASYSLDAGFASLGIFGGGGVTGYKNVRQVLSEQQINPGYGFLYAERGKDNPQGIMDFIRENENPIIPTTPNLAVAIQMPDMFTYTSQSGSGQFRLYRGGTGAFFDNEEEDQYDNHTFGGDIGIGPFGVHGGVTYYRQTSTTSTRKWTGDNDYIEHGDFQKESTTNPNAQHVFFREIGEKNLPDQDMLNRINGTNAVEVEIDGKHAGSFFRSNADFYGSTISVPNIKKGSRQPNRTMISYLTAQEASLGALDKTIMNYAVNDSATFVLPANHKPIPTQSLLRVDPVDATDYTQHPPAGQDPNSEPDHIQIHKPHHISEISVMDDGGKRMIYGIPVYNLQHDEYSFAAGTVGTYNATKNNVNVPGSQSTGIDHYGRGIDDYYHKETKPPYATSYLLTDILSPDYVDVTGNGISDDDLGTAIKFNYSKLNYAYKWRTPYNNATLNKGLLADPDDDKGSIVCGKKEVWYINSIESKTKIVYFITKERRDALGASDDWTQGGRDTTNKLRYLSEIRMYSKADMSRPIKVIKFRYTYQLCRGIPNSADLGSTDPYKGGKLTLTRVWFEYGNIQKGKNFPYVFSYNTTANGTTPEYDYMMTDRWGTYKPRSENIKALDNDEFPYAGQNKNTSDQYAALWQLKKVELPTGGVINVNYESDDYAYVQNRKAMVMSNIESLFYTDASGIRHDLTDTLSSSFLRDAQGVKVHIATGPPSGVNETNWFKTNYLDGSEYMYTKLYVNVSTSNSSATANNGYDFIPCYARIRKVVVSGSDAYVSFEPITDANVTANPIIMAAWQHMKNEYPRYAYPGFDNRVNSDQSSILGVISATANAAKNLTELSKNFYQTAYSNKYATQVSMCKSFVRLTKHEANGVKSGKIGGGSRVKSIQIKDSWSAMTGNANAPSGAYGQAYDYTTTDNGQPVSSGVAAYEPAVGNDENPFKQPVIYTQTVKGGIDNYMDIEEPFAESLFPAPIVTYSKVTVSNLAPDGTPDASLATGLTVNEFYTSKDFPVKVNVLPIFPVHQPLHHYFSLVNTVSDDELCLSQGYSIELNDMNGKPKAVRVLNQSGSEVSSTYYYYKATDHGGLLTLNNQVNIVNSDGTISTNKTIGQDVEFFTDFREQESVNKGKAVNIGFDIASLSVFTIYMPHIPIGTNDDYKLFRSASALKVIQTYGIIDHVEKKENGSRIITENMAFDGLTGEALITRTQNEFKNNVYSVNLPAYWAYPSMGAAYKNMGVILSNFTTDGNGQINTNYSSYLAGGDEIVDLTNGSHYWVIDNQAVPGPWNNKKLIGRDGRLVTGYTPQSFVKIVRSGFRNILGASTSSIVCLNDPTANNTRLQLANATDLTALKVINASANTFDEKWTVNKVCLLPDQSYTTVNSLYPTFSHTTLPANLLATGYVLDQNDNVVYNSNNTPYYTLSPYMLSNSHFSNVAANSGLTTANGSSVKVVGFDTCITVPQTKQYYLGTGGYCFVTVDGHPWARSAYAQDNGKMWMIFNVPNGYLAAGKHVIHVEYHYLSPNNNPWSLANPYNYFGVEIYNNTLADLTGNDNTGASINTIFTTANLNGVTNIRSWYAGTTGALNYHYVKANGTPLDACNDQIHIRPLPNPYLAGYLGNWRQYQNKVYQQSRNYSDIFNPAKNGMDVANAGYINNFSSYWYYGTLANGQPGWIPNPGATRWVTANTITLYDKYGQQLENKDALGRYSAATFDFNGELPSAVASNAMNREIYANSFEDTKFRPGTLTVTDTCNVREFISPLTGKTIRQMADSSISHSGNYSAKLPASGGVILSTITYSLQQKTSAYLASDNSGQYLTQNITGLYPNGFEPYPNKKYIFNAWVKDNHPENNSVNLSLSMNGSPVTLNCKAVVEGWKLVEGTLDLSALGSGSALNIAIVPNSGAAIYIDDIRMHPFDAHLKTYAYDDRTLRLMAEIDENGFATFYEYNNEGLLIRVKKETERGVMTLKENRASYKQRTN